MALGSLAKVQIGIETEYGTSVTPDLALSVTSISPATELTKITSNALVGTRAQSGITAGPYTVSGSFEVEAKPDEIQTLIYLATGVEGSPGEVVEDEVYTHAFTPATAGNETPSFTLVVDDTIGESCYTGCKINNLSFSVDPDGYLMATVEYVGQQYGTSQTIQPLSLSTKKPFTYVGAKVSTGTAGSTAASTLIDAISVSPSYNNNIEDTRQRMDGNRYSAERRIGRLEVMSDIEADWSSAMKVIRDTNYLADTSLSIQVLYESNDVFYDTHKYHIQFDIPYANVTNFPVEITGPEHITSTVSVSAFEVSPTPVCTFTVQDERATAWSA
jgi:hypothetical protein